MKESNQMSKKPIKVGFISLGCPKNRVDTEIMLHDLVEAGFEITPEETEADVAIVNTCAFIEEAKRESIEEILDLAYLKKHHKLKAIVVSGCMAERYRDEVISEMPEVDAIIGVGGLHSVVDAVRAALARAKDSSAPRFSAFPDKEAMSLGGDRVITTTEFSTYLKIAEGCSNNCAYCAIPMIRGRMRSRSMEDVLDEARSLVSLGVRELNVIAQDTTSWGVDLYKEYRLPELVRRLGDTGADWVRLLYCYPDRVTPELARAIAETKNCVPYIDLPIQHVSDNVLRLMRRRGGKDAIRRALYTLREAVPGIAIRTTLLVGFPGETEADYEELRDFIVEADFTRLGVFAYSREEGTPAYDMEPQVPEEDKNRRRDELMELQATICARRTFTPHTERALIEGYDVVAETHYGRLATDAPEIDGKVFVSCADPKLRIAPGSFVDVALTERDEYDAYGDLVAPAGK